MKTSTKSILGGRVEVIGPADCVGAVASHIETTISGPAAAVQPLKPALDDPYTLSQIMANFDTMREVQDLNWCQQFASSVIDRGINAMPADDSSKLNLRICRMAGMLAEAAGLADDTAQWLSGDESYDPAKLAEALTKLAMDCREASNNVQSLKVVIEVSGGVAEVTTCPTGVEVEIMDHDNEKVGL